MKKLITVAVIGIVCAVAVASSIGDAQMFREEYGGWLGRKTMDERGKTLWMQTTLNGGLESPLDTFTVGTITEWDGIGPRPGPDDPYGDGTTYVWWGDGDQRQITGFRWHVTQARKWTREPFSIEGSGQPVGVSFIRGLKISPDRLSLSLGAFHYSMANLGHLTQEVELVVDWETQMGEPDQITHHQMTVEPVKVKSLYPKPITHGYGFAREIAITREAK